MRRYVRLFDGAWGSLLLAAVLLGLAGLLPGAAVWLLREATDAVFEGRAVQPLVAALVAIAALQGTVTLIRNAITRRVANQRVHELRMRLHAQFQASAHPMPVGQRLAAATVEVDELRYGVSAVVTAIRAPVTLVILAGSAWWMAPDLALRFTAVLPVVLLVSWAGSALIRRRTRAWRLARAALLEELTDQYGGLDTTLDLRIETLQQTRAHRLSATEARSRAQLEWAGAVPNVAIELTMAIAVALLLAWGASAVAQGRTTPGGLVGFTLAVVLIRRPLSQLAEVTSLTRRSLAALDRVLAILAEPTEAAVAKGAGEFRWHGAVDGRLDPIQLTIPAGQKVAVVGASGAGKSTLLAVLAGRLAQEGKLVRSPAMWLRQDPWVFDRTLRDNLELGHSGPAEDLLGTVGLQALAARLDERIGTRGAQLSGGEAQRVCLARALAAAPGALLLDEATSEVQPELARRLADHLAQIPATVVFATHETWFPCVADRVLWLDAGEVRGDGPHAELLEHPDYRALWGLE